MTEPFLNIETKQDSLERIQALIGVPSKFTYSAAEWNLIRNKINELHQVLEGTDLDETFNNNIKVDFRTISGLPNNHDISHVRIKISSLPTFEVSGNQLLVFRTYTTVVSGNGTGLGIGSVGGTAYDLIVNYWIFRSGKGTYGIGADPIKNTDIAFWNRVSTQTHQPLVFELGEIGSTPIEDEVDSSGPYGVSEGTVVTFKVLRNGEEKNYLWQGQAETVGIGYSGTFSDDYFLLETLTPAPQNPSLNYITQSYFKETFGTTPIPDFATIAENKLNF